MGFLSSLIGGGIGNLAEGVSSAIDKFVETDEEKKAAELLLMKVQQEPDKWQAEINKIEAGHRSIFIAGWRPFIGWVCGFGLAYAFIVKPVAQAILTSCNVLTLMPSIQTGELMTLVFAMLGMGGIRTYEKRHKLTN